MVKGSIDPRRVRIQEYADWHFLIFLIFNKIWMLSIDINIFLNTVLTLYHLVYVGHYPGWVTGLYYLFEVHFCTDTVLAILHRLWERIRKQRFSECRHIGEIMMDILTLIPYYEIYYVICVDSPQYKDYTRVKCFFRYIIMMEHIFSTRGILSGFNNILVIFIRQAFLLNTSTLFFSTVWYLLSCNNKPKCTDPTWSDWVVNHKFNHSDNSNWFVISYVTVLNMHLQQLSIGIHPMNNKEYLLVILLLLIGFNMNHLFFVGKLIAVLIHTKKKQYLYVDKLNRISQTLKDWGIKRRTRQQVMTYSSELWLRREGLRDLPETFQMIPPSLKKNITMDIFWDVFRHSHLFSEIDNGLKRIISLAMKEDFLLPGHYLYRAGDMKTTMYYIINGDLQILSDEDRQTPVMNITTGSLICESSCVMGGKSHVSIRCSTMCEVQTLCLYDLYRIITKSSYKGKCICDKLKERIEQARRTKERSRKLIRSYETLEDKYTTPIRRYKKNWQRVWNATEDPNNRKLIKQLMKNLDGSYCSTYMDQIVINSQTDVQVKSICLTNKCPFVMDPDSSFRRFFRIMALVSILLHASIIPYFIFFLHYVPQDAFVLCIFLDVFCWIEFYMDIITAIRKSAYQILTPIEVLFYKIKRPMFLLDLFSVIPLDYVVAVGTSQSFVVAFMKINRLLILYKVLVLLLEWERSPVGQPVMKRFVKYFFSFSVVTYFSACVLFFVACPDKCRKHGWMVYNHELQKKSITTNKLAQLQVSLNVAVTLILQLNYKNFYGYTIRDFNVFFLIVLIGYCLKCLCLSEISCAAMQRGILDTMYTAKIKPLKHFLIHSKLGTFMTKRIIYHLEYRWYHKRFNTDDEDLMKKLPSDLRNTVQYKRLVKLLKSTEFFGMFTQEHLNHLAKVAKISIMQPNSVIVSRGHICPTMHVLRRGVCRMYSRLYERHPMVSFLEPGSTFSILETLYHIPSLVTVTSVTDIELVSIPESIFRRICSMYPTTFLKETIESFIIDDYINTLSEKRKQKTRSRRSRMSSKASRSSSFNKFASVLLFKCAILTSTINPTSKFFMAWEVLYCALALVQFYISINCLNKFFKDSLELVWIQYILDIIGWVDIYFRMRLQYYNEKGLLITHPFSTVTNYVRTSFFLDLYGIFPFHFLSLDMLFVSTNRKYLGYHIYILVSRTVQLYRVRGLLLYLAEGNRGCLNIIVRCIILLLIYLVLQLICVTFMYLTICTLDEHNFTHKCPPSSPVRYLEVIGADPNMFPAYIRELLEYSLASFFIINSNIVITMMVTEELQIVFPIVVIMATFRMYVITSFVSMTVGGIYQTIVNRNRVTVLEDYVKRENIVDNDLEYIIAEFQFQYRRSKGIDFIRDIKILDQNLRHCILEKIYSSTLSSVPIFKDASMNFIRMITKYISIRYYIKGAKIIQCNDVQNKLFIVYKGIVDVFVGDILVATMGNGSIFGSISPKGNTRQTITVMSNIHVELLVLNAHKFNLVVKDYPHIVRQLKLARYTNVEYLKAGEVHHTKSSISVIKTRDLCLVYNILIMNLNARLKYRPRLRKVISYLFYYHFTPISVFSTMIYHIFVNNQAYKMLLIHLVYLMDLLFLFRLFVELNLRYVDPELGIMVDNPKMIRRRYPKWLIVVDVLTSIPLDMLMKCIPGVIKDNFAYGFLIRCLRMIYFYHYYYSFKTALSVKMINKLVQILYSTIFYILILAVLWLTITCRGYKCKYWNMTVQNRTIVETTSILDSILRSVLFATNQLTCSSLLDMSPMLTREILWYKLIIFTVPIILVILICSAANIFNSSYHIQMSFFKKTGRLLRVLKENRLSEPLLMETEKYFNVIWALTKGENIPKMLQVTPRYLKQSLMATIYGRHLESHFLFSETHVDFLRQIVTRISRYIFLTDHEIVAQGESDGCMYFVHSGEVQCRQVLLSGEEFAYILPKGSAFGEGPGLFNVPHSATYYCKTVSDIIILHRDNWHYLLCWFPASKEKIVQKAREYRVVGANNKKNIDAFLKITTDVYY